MLFQIVWVREFTKDEKTTSKKVWLLIEVEKFQEARDFLNTLWIVIISYKEYKWEKKDFGSVIFKADFNNKEITLISDIKKVKDTYDFFARDLRCKITYINSLVKPLPEDKVEIILKQLKKRVADYYQRLRDEKNNKTKSILEKLEESTEKQKQKKIDKLKNMVAWLIKDNEKNIKKYNWIVANLYLRQLKDITDNLKKARMWNNLNKMIMVVEDSLRISEKIELAAMDQMQKQEVESITWTLISELDVVLEYEKYKKADRLVKASKVQKVKMSLTDHYYSILGKVWIYPNLLVKETKNRAEQNKLIDMLYWTFDWIELFCVFFLIITSLILLYKKLFWMSNFITNYYSILYVWLFSLLLYMFKQFRSKNLLNIGIVYLIIIVLFIIGRSFISSTFAF